MSSNYLKNYEPIEHQLTKEQVLETKVKFLRCILEEHSFEAIMKTQTPFLQAKTQADILAICFQQREFLSIDFLGNKRQKMLRILKRYNIKSNLINLKHFLKLYREDIEKIDENYLEINSLERIFDNTLSKDQYPFFEKEIGFQSAIIYPIKSRDGIQIGYIIYFYLNNLKPIKKNLALISELLEFTIQPLYDLKNHTFFSKVIRLSSFVPDLTVREKTITRRLLKGYSNTQIADELYISVNTVKTHIKNIFIKFNVNSKMELANKLKNIDL